LTYRLARGSEYNLADVDRLLETLNTLDSHPVGDVRDLFDSGRGLVVTRAPGRLDVMGGIADYSGSLVLQWPLNEAALVALQRDPARCIRIVSLNDGGSEARPAFEVPISEFETSLSPIDYQQAADRFRLKPEQHWASYVAGAFLVLMREKGIRFDEGARILVASQVPEGRGVSSSAAIEVATMEAIAAAFNVALTGPEIALLSQMVENRVVGAPCGVMDQMTASCGERGRLLALLCQPAELLGTIAVPGDLALWGIDSGLSHQVSGQDYASVRIGAFMGYRMIASIVGLSSRSISDGLVEIDDPKWNGFLARISPSEFEQHYAAQLPLEMSGGEFLKRHGGTTDKVTRVNASINYRVRVPTAHPIYEDFRVRSFAALLQATQAESTSELLGELMYQSHSSYSACGLGSDGTDLIVELVRTRGAARGLYGAKVTGGGSGGTVAVLGRRDCNDAVSSIAEEYEGVTGIKARIFSGSSPSSSSFGHLRLEPETD
jgi:galactokinase